MAVVPLAFFGLLLLALSSSAAASGSSAFAIVTPGSSLLSSSSRPSSPLRHHQQHQHHHRRHRASDTTRLYNLFDDIGSMAGEMIGANSALESESNLPYNPPLCGGGGISEHVRTFAVRERAISFTGEDFDIADAADGSEFARVRGAMLHLPGKDKMRVYSSSTGEEAVVLDRVLMAATPSYDIYRGGSGGLTAGEKIGWIEKKLVAFTDSFDLYMEGNGGFGVTGLFKPTPAYRIEGDFLDRNFAFKNAEGKIVARARMDGWVQFDAFNHYQVQVAPGMDALLVMSCVCAIDEEFDEEHKKRKA